MAAATLKALDEWEQARRRILELDALATQAESCVEAFKGTLPSGRVSIGYQQGTLKGVLLFFDVDDFRALLPVRRWLRANIALPSPQVGDSPSLHRREWTYGNLVLAGFLPWNEGSACSYVQVGVKEEPIYELRCGGAPVAEGVE